MGRCCWASPCTSAPFVMPLRQSVEVPDEFHYEIIGRAAKIVYERYRETEGLSMNFDERPCLNYSYYAAHAEDIVVRPGALKALQMFQQLDLQQAPVSNSDRIVVNAKVRVWDWKCLGSSRCQSMM
jgi:hypothetical protein